MTIIPLASPTLARSSNRPGSIGWAIRVRLRPFGLRRDDFPIWSCSVRGFACHPCYHRCGALLPHLFTLTFGSPLRGSPFERQDRRDGQERQDGQTKIWFLTFQPIPPIPPLLPLESEPRRGEPSGGMFSVPLSFELPRPGVTRRTALRSSDFPPTFALRGSSIVLRWASPSSPDKSRGVPARRSSNLDPPRAKAGDRLAHCDRGYCTRLRAPRFGAASPWLAVAPQARRRLPVGFLRDLILLEFLV